MRIGVDVEQVRRFRKFKRSSAFVRRYYSPHEIAYCYSKPHPFLHLAARFAAKEAYFKASGSKTSFSKIEVRNGASGKPFLWVNGKKSTAQVSLSHSPHCAFAAVALP